MKFGETLESQDTNAQLTADLEKYLGKTLRLRVVAEAAEGGTVLPSPYSAYSSEFIVATRVASPTATAVKFADIQPTQQTFLSGMKMQFTVGDTAAFHYVTGYLFQNEMDYKPKRRPRWPRCKRHCGISCATKQAPSAL